MAQILHIFAGALQVALSKTPDVLTASQAYDGVRMMTKLDKGAQ